MEKVTRILNHRALVLIIICLVTIFVFSNIVGNGFVWDDSDFYQNWTSLYTFDRVGELLAGEVPVQHEGVYRPLRSIIQLFLFQTIGPDNSIAYHIVSILIHLAAIIAVYFLLGRLTKNNIITAVATALFALHPIHTESITYLTTSIDVIGAVFLFWALYFYLRWCDLKIKKELIISIIFSTLAYFTYELALVIPVLLLLIEWHKNNYDLSSAIKMIKNHIAYWLMAIIFIIMRIAAGTGSRVLTPDADQSGLATRMLSMGKAFVKYIYLLIFPLELNVFHKIDLSNTIAEPKVLFSWLGVIALISLAIYFAKKLKIISFAILWFFVAMAPFSNIFPTGIIMAEKYTYVASLSIAIILAVLIHKLLSQKKTAIAGLLIFLIIAGFYGYRTFARNMDWKSDETLWAATLKQRPDYGRVYSNLGFSLYKQDKFVEARDLYLKAAELEPRLPLIFHNLGNVYDELGDYEKSISYFQQAIEKQEGAEYYNYAETHNNLGIVLEKLNRLEEAAQQYQKAVEFDPDYFRAYSNLGFLQMTAGDFGAAKQSFEKALKINSEFAPAEHGLAVVLLNQGQTEMAVERYIKSQQYDPSILENYIHLAAIYQQQNKLDKIVEILETGNASLPDQPIIMLNLAVAYANENKISEASQLVSRVLIIDPENQEAISLQTQLQQILETRQ